MKQSTGESAELFANEGFHARSGLFDALQQADLVAGTLEVVRGVRGLVVRVAVQIVGEETHALHVGEECRGVRQVLDFDLGEEAACALEITAGEGFEDVETERDVVEVRIVLARGIGRRAEEVAEVGEDERGHHGVEVDDTEHVAVAVEEDVVDLRVAMANALGEFAFAVEALALGHLLFTLTDFVEQGFHLGLLDAAGFIFGDGFFELLDAELDVVEILDRLAELCGQIGEHGLELGEGLADDGGILHAHAALGGGVGDEHHHTPIFLTVVVVVFAVLGGHKTEHFAVDIGGAGGFELLANVAGDFDDVVHQQIDVGEDGYIDVLQHVVCAVAFGFHGVGGVDQPVAEGMDVTHFALNGEMGYDVFELLFHCGEGF